MANKPNNPSLWSKAKSLAKQKFDVYPSAYANGWAAKWYKSKGGTWRKAQDGMVVYPLDYQPNLPMMNIGGLFPRFMEEGGQPDGDMALGQMAAVVDKLSKLREFVNAESDLEPWISSKLAVMDHYADAVYDEMMYGEVGDEGEEYEEEDEEEEEAPMTENELNEMREGGIPERYRKRGFTRVGAKRQSTRPGKKWMVLAKKGDQYKIVHGGYKGMKDFTQHRNKNRQKKFWSRMGGRNSSKATDPFSPLYWHKRFGTWEDGGELPKFQWGDKAERGVCSVHGVPYMGGGAGGGKDEGTGAISGVPWTKVYDEYYANYDRDFRKKNEPVYNTLLQQGKLPQGLSLKDYLAAQKEADEVNKFFTGDYYAERFFDSDNPTVPKADLATQVPTRIQFYRAMVPNIGRKEAGRRSLEASDILNLMSVEDRKALIGRGYRAPQQKYGGNTNNNLNTNFMNPLYDFIERAQMGGQQDPQQDQIMQLIQMYAELQGIDPNAIIQQLQELPTNQQQQAIEQMMQEVQAAMQQQGGGQGMMQQEQGFPQQPMMRRGGNMPCFECGGMYQGGGMMMDDQYGGLVMPAMPMLDAYGLPLYAEGGSKNWIQKAVKRPGRCTPGSPNYDCPKGSPQWNLAQRFKSGEFRKKKMYGGMTEMAEGGKPSWLVEAQLKAQGFSGPALSNKMSQIGKASYGGVADMYEMGSGGYTGTFSGNAYYQNGGVAVGDVVDATPEMLAWLDANGYTYTKA